MGTSASKAWEPQWATWEQTVLHVAHGNTCLKGLGTTMSNLRTDCFACSTWEHLPQRPGNHSDHDSEETPPRFHFNFCGLETLTRKPTVHTAFHSTVTLEPLCGVETVMIKLYCDVMIKLEKTVHSVPLHRHTWTSVRHGKPDDQAREGTVLSSTSTSLWLGKTDKKADCPQHSTLPSRLNLSVAWKPWWSSFTVMIKLEKTVRSIPLHRHTWTSPSAAWKTWSKPERGLSSVPLQLLYGEDNVMSKPERRLSCEIHFMLALKLTRIWKPWWANMNVGSESHLKGTHDVLSLHTPQIVSQMPPDHPFMYINADWSPQTCSVLSKWHKANDEACSAIRGFYIVKKRSEEEEGKKKKRERKKDHQSFKKTIMLAQLISLF